MSNAEKKPGTVVLAIPRPDDLKGKQKAIGGSMSDGWNDAIAGEVINTLWTKHLDDDEANKLRTAAVEALIGIKPQDEIEGMLAAQIIACHNASMECYRRAMLAEQTFEGRHENLNQANKLSRTYATLVEALNRHRGKGQQKVTVEHVQCMPAARQWSVWSRPRGEGIAPKSEEQPHARQLAHAPEPAMRSTDKAREPVPIPGDAERPLPDARRTISGRTER